MQLDAEDLAPQVCAILALEAIVMGQGKFSGSKDNDLILGGPRDDKIDGKGGDDCLIGGWGEDELDGDTGTDVCIGRQGTKFKHCEYEYTW